MFLAFLGHVPESVPENKLLTKEVFITELDLYSEVILLNKSSFSFSKRCPEINVFLVRFNNPL
ncbi:hypothetical protein Cal7507_1344 [Calothrix sp. PCC 7507]|nr:hypothetical protein Cal7507_1344 [Calothrix sp. PCC 7507]